MNTPRFWAFHEDRAGYERNAQFETLQEAKDYLISVIREHGAGRFVQIAQDAREPGSRFSNWIPLMTIDQTAVVPIS